MNESRRSNGSRRSGDPSRPRHVLLGEVEVDLFAGDVYREGRQFRLEPQPAKVLELLLDRAGELVSRDELKQFLWGDSQHVEADQGLNYCISELRRALGDSARQPHFIETLPRRGYRLLAPVESIESAGESDRAPGRSSGGDESAPSGLTATDRASPRRTARRRWVSVAAVAAIVVGLTAFAGLVVELPDPADSEASEPSRSVSSGALADPSDERADTATERAARLLVRARFLQGQEEPAQKEKALAAAREAIRLRPRLAEAHLLYGEILLDLPRPPRTTVPQARQAFERAIALEPDLAPAYVGLGRIALFYRRHLEAAVRDLEQAVEVEPGLADAHYYRALVLAALGRDGEAVAAMDRARELDPLAPIIHVDLGFIHYFGGRYSVAFAKAREALDLDPESMVAAFLGMVSALRLGERETALEHARLLVELAEAPPGSIETISDYWRWQLAWYRHETASGRYHSPTVAARAYLHLGRTDEALEALEAACAERSGWFMPFLAVDPDWRPLAGRPEFESLLACSRGASGRARASDPVE